MRIQVVAYLHGNGGAERQITLLANQLSKKGHAVFFIILVDSNICYPLDEKIKIYDLSKEEKGSGLRRIFMRFNALRKVTKEIRPDVSIHYWLQSAYFSVLFQRKYRGKVVYSERGDPYDKEFDGIVGVLRWISNFMIDGFVFQSEGAQNFFSEKIKKRSVVIHNSVNVPQEKYPIPVERESRIVSVGRLHHQKNQKVLIEAFALISDKYPLYKLEIYGDGALRNDLEKLIINKNLQGRVLLCGTTNNIFDRICNASLFVLSSDYEGIPNALLEAMALGLPCISTDCRPGGARTLIEDGKNGFIVPVADAEKMAERIDYVLGNKNVANAIAIEARKISATHTDEAVFDKWERFLKKI